MTTEQERVSYDAAAAQEKWQRFWESDGTVGPGMVPNLTNQIVGFAGADACPFPIFGTGGPGCSVIALRLIAV